jgi:hypothetical protein
MGNVGSGSDGAGCGGDGGDGAGSGGKGSDGAGRTQLGSSLSASSELLCRVTSPKQLRTSMEIQQLQVGTELVAVVGCARASCHVERIELLHTDKKQASQREVGFIQKATVSDFIAMDLVLQLHTPLMAEPFVRGSGKQPKSRITLFYDYKKGAAVAWGDILSCGNTIEPPYETRNRRHMSRGLLVMKNFAKHFGGKPPVPDA